MYKKYICISKSLSAVCLTEGSKCETKDKIQIWSVHDYMYIAKIYNIKIIFSNCNACQIIILSLLNASENPTYIFQ